ncbi:MAG: hypothetical protein BWY42_00351 [Candidatus Omnitrophica bacterium ADurb.Bin277]|nr:MAG: hypothetical protein BWY42_00351 [Candidatus Omnitrophica bacterium ADurb.Bin277]
MIIREIEIQKLFSASDQERQITAPGHFFLLLKPPLLEEQEDIRPENVFERVEHHRFDRIEKFSGVSTRFRDALENLHMIKIHPGILEAPGRHAFFCGNKIRRAIHQTGLAQIILVRGVHFRILEQIQPLGHQRSRGALNQDKIELFSLSKPCKDTGYIPLSLPGGVSVLNVQKKNRLISG